MITLVLGGARSGKSEVAEGLVAVHGSRVAYVATAEVTDADFAARVQRHRDRRDASWTTLELADADLPAVVAAHPDSADAAVLIDSLGTWVARTPAFAADASALVRALQGRIGLTVVVSEEVGMGVHPETEVGRQFRDALGLVNRVVADAADEVLLVVAGRTLRLPAP